LREIAEEKDSRGKSTAFDGFLEEPVKEFPIVILSRADGEGSATSQLSPGDTIVIADPSLPARHPRRSG